MSTPCPKCAEPVEDHVPDFVVTSVPPEGKTQWPDDDCSFTLNDCTVTVAELNAAQPEQPGPT